MAQSLGTATLTGRTGPSLIFTAIPAPNLRRVEINLEDSLGRAEWIDNSGAQRFVEWDLVLTTTLTDTIAALLNTIVVSGT